MNRLENFLRGSPEKNFDPMALARMKADTLNAEAGDLTGYHCEKCRNRGYSMTLGPEGNLVSVPCDCMAIRRCLRETECSGLGEVLRSKTFDSFQAQHRWQKRLLQVCRDYARQPQGWLLLCGQSGCGKTHLCAAVCHSFLMAGRQVRYLSWREFTVRIKGLAGEYDRQQRELEVCKNAQVLYIDDLFKCGGNPTAADISLAFELVNHRYQKQLLTVISTELTPGQLSQLDEATGSRLIEMAGDNLLNVLQDQEKNYRLRRVKHIDAQPSPQGQ